MLVKSQNGMKLISTDSFYIRKEYTHDYLYGDGKSEEFEFRIGGYKDSEHIDLGIYKTKERALEILNEIQFKIVFLKAVKDSPDLMKEISDNYSIEEFENTFVYKMPEE